MAHFDRLKWPTCTNPDGSMNRDGQKKESGTIRRDPPRTCGRTDDQRVSEETRRAPANGAASDSQRSSAGEEEGGRGRAEVGSGEGTHRPHAGIGPACTAQTKAYGTSDLGAFVQRTSGTSSGRTNDPAICAREEAGFGTQRPGGVCAAELQPGAGRPGRLVRGNRQTGRRACKLRFFAMRSMGSGDTFHRAYTHATQQALLLRMPDPEDRHRYAVALAEELMQFERPMPGMDEYDLLLTAPAGGIQ